MDHLRPVKQKQLPQSQGIEHDRTVQCWVSPSSALSLVSFLSLIFVLTEERWISRPSDLVILRTSSWDPSELDSRAKSNGVNPSKVNLSCKQIWSNVWHPFLLSISVIQSEHPFISIFSDISISYRHIMSYHVILPFLALMYWLANSIFRVFKADVTMSVNSPHMNTGCRGSHRWSELPNRHMPCDVFLSSTCDTFLSALHQCTVVLMLCLYGVFKHTSHVFWMLRNANTRFKHLGSLVSPNKVNQVWEIKK